MKQQLSYTKLKERIPRKKKTFREAPKTILAQQAWYSSQLRALLANQKGNWRKNKTNWILTKKGALKKMKYSLHAEY